MMVASRGMRIRSVSQERPRHGRRGLLAGLASGSAGPPTPLLAKRRSAVSVAKGGDSGCSVITCRRGRVIGLRGAAFFGGAVSVL